MTTELMIQLGAFARRVLFPIHTRPDGSVLAPDGYAEHAKPPLQKVQALRVDAHQVCSIESLSSLLADDSARTLAAVRIAGAAIVVAVIDPEQPERGTYLASIPLGLSFQALLGFATWKGYATFAEWLAVRDVAMDEKDRACLLRLRAAKTVELDQSSSDGALRVSWAARGAENAAVPPSLRAVVPVIDGATSWRCNVDAPLLFRPDPAGGLPQVRLHVSPERLVSDATEMVAQALSKALKITVVAGQLESSRWAP